MPVMRATPRSSAAWSVSSSQVGMPAFRKQMAMPPPMVPAPMTAAFVSGRSGVDSGMSATLPAARSAKKE